ncbi:hypothetical protein HMPREF0880_01995 [Yokenella regensburgei ATCC 43003]|nr:hypothetical protein HMPREF0880_01995 [Yokenella regensburgei ATCC 43003]
MLVIHRFVMMDKQVSVYLRACAIDHHQADTQAVKKTYIIHNTGEIFMLNGFSSQHNDKCFTPMCIDIGDGMAKSFNQFGSTLLHHGKTLCA